MPTLTLINAFEVPSDKEDEIPPRLGDARDYLQTQPGYVDTALHQAVTPDADFRFVNVGRWQSADDFRAATQSDGFRQAEAGLANFRPHPGLYRVVRT